MNEKKLFNLIIALIIVIFLTIAYILFTRPVSAPDKNAPATVSIAGTIACLPKTGTGNQTMECAIGLKGSDNKHYSLKNLAKHDPEHKFSTTGLSVKVRGVLKSEDSKGPDGNKYDIAGSIDVSSIEAVAK